ncbi:MAG: type I methionyl aminopeptidase, partial [Candidatus Margulisbacteria bacterium]|nr:type I methionyl aminopeptidase [Candidatus Margulisiibacteriota bacterium]
MIRLKTEEEVNIMREGGRILAYIFDELASLVKVGVNALYLDEAVRKIILKNGATPSF